MTLHSIQEDLQWGNQMVRRELKFLRVSKIDGALRGYINSKIISGEIIEYSSRINGY